MTQLPRALTTTEKGLLRSEPQSSRFYLTVHDPATVYSARLAAVPSSTDQVTSITYNSGSGTHTSILSDQTLWIGTSAGTYDLGMARIRNLTGIGATSGTFEIAEESEIDWAANAYLTVKDEFSIWPKHIYMDGTTPYLDYDVAYTDENSLCDSVPVMGQHRVLWLEGATVSGTFDAGESWELNNTITGYVWTAPGASATSGLTTATPTITYNATGVYRISCAVTNDDGKTFIGYRYVFVINSTSSAPLLCDDIIVESVGGDYETGGWSAQVRMFDDADLSVIRDRALCILHTRDTYGSSNDSIGFNAGNEGALLIGWIAGETIIRAPDDLYSSVTFTIEGPHYWLNRIPAFPVGLKDRTTTPTKWTRFEGLSLKAAVWHFLHWRTTITRCCDVFNTPNGYRAARIEAPGAQTLWEQLKYIEWTTVLAKPCADRYGRLHNQIEQQLLGTTDRAAVPECMTLTQQDISGDVEIERSTVSNASIVDVSGFSYDGSAGTPYFSLSPGHVFRRYGDAPEVVDRLVLYDQATTNTLCGLYAGWRNNEYPRVSMLLGAGNRFVDIAPYQYWLYAVAAADSPRGIAESLRLIPRRVTYQIENTGGYLLARVDFENENTEQLAVTGDTPEEIPYAPPITPPIEPPIIPVPLIEQNLEGVVMLVNSTVVGTTAALVYASDITTTSQPTWTSLALPSDFNTASLIPHSKDYDSAVHVNYLGTRLLITGIETGASKRSIWECTNWASIKNNPTPPAPIWSLRVKLDVTTIGGSTVAQVSSYSFGQGAFEGDIFYFTCKVAGTWSIGAIAADGTLSKTSPTSTNQNLGISYNCYNDINLTSGTSYIRDRAGAVIYSFSGTLNGTNENRNPKRTGTGEVVTGYQREAGATDYLAIRSSGGYHDIGARTGGDNYVIITSSAAGGGVAYATADITDDALVSTDGGATWGAFATWYHGALLPMHGTNDSGALWCPYESISSGSVPVRIYDNAGSVTLDITGNWWSDVFATSTATNIQTAKAWYA